MIIPTDVPYYRLLSLAQHAKLARWRAKYLALGLSKTQVERIIAKRRYSRHL